MLPMIEPTEARAINDVQEILTDIVKSVVTRPDRVSVHSSIHGPLVAFVIKTEQIDVRRVIGSKGKHFKAMETIVQALMRIMDREAHLTVDEKGPPPVAAHNKPFSLGATRPDGVRNVVDLLRRVIGPFLQIPEAMDVISTNLGTTTILELRVKESDYPLIYGTETVFDYGPDGHLIGSIKNIFDGIGKNNGRIIRITVNRI